MATSILESIIKKMDEANAANLKRYSQGLSTLRGSLSRTRDLYGQANQAIQGIGTTAMSDVNRGAQRALAQGRQGLISSGLGNSTITGSLYRGVEEDRRRAMGRVEENMAGLRAGALQQQAGAEAAGNAGIANFIAARNDIGPDLGLLASLQQQASRANAATGGTGGTGGGKMRSYSIAPMSLPRFFDDPATRSGVGGGGGVGMSPSSISSAVRRNVPSSRSPYAATERTARSAAPSASQKLSWVRGDDGQLTLTNAPQQQAGGQNVSPAEQGPASPSVGGGDVGFEDAFAKASNFGSGLGLGSGLGEPLKNSWEYWGGEPKTYEEYVAIMKKAGKRPSGSMSFHWGEYNRPWQ